MQKLQWRKTDFQVDELRITEDKLHTTQFELSSIIFFYILSSFLHNLLLLPFHFKEHFAPNGHKQSCCYSDIKRLGHASAHCSQVRFICWFALCCVFNFLLFFNIFVNIKRETRGMTKSCALWLDLKSNRNVSMWHVSIWFYTTTELSRALWLVDACHLLEYSRTDDVTGWWDFRKVFRNISTGEARELCYWTSCYWTDLVNNLITNKPNVNAPI